MKFESKYLSFQLFRNLYKIMFILGVKKIHYQHIEYFSGHTGIISTSRLYNRNLTLCNTAYDDMHLVRHQLQVEFEVHFLSPKVHRRTHAPRSKQESSSAKLQPSLNPRELYKKIYHIKFLLKNKMKINLNEHAEINDIFDSSVFNFVYNYRNDINFRMLI